MQIWPSPRTALCTTSPENGTEMTSRNPYYKDINLLRGRPHVSEEHALYQEAQQEEPKEDAGQQHQGHERTCRGYQGPCESQRGQAPNPKVWQPQAQLTCLHHLPQAWKTSLGLYRQGSQALLTKGQSQS